MSDLVTLPLPATWAQPSVSEVGRVRVGRQRSPERMTGRYFTKYLRAANIGPDGLQLADVLEMDFTPAEQATFGLRAGDIVLAEASGSASQVGRAAVWREELPLCCIQNTIIRFRPHAALPEYALTVFRHYAASGVFSRTARGVGILHLGGARFSQLPFPLPPLPEQRRIASEVEARIQQLRLAERSLRSALESTNQQDVAILAAAVCGELVKPHGDSGTKTPESWSSERIDAVGTVTLGKARSPASDSGPSMRPYLRVANVLEDHIDLTDVNEMNFSQVEFEKYLLEPGDILLNEGQSPELVGRPAMYRGERPGLCFQNALLRFRAGPGVDPEFALFVFRHYLHAGEFRRVARWSTNIAHLSRARFASMTFPLPPLAEQREIATEARHRLQTSSDQREGILAALERLPGMMAEILAAATAGSLVTQDPDDGTAAEYLATLGSPPHDKVVIEEPNIEEGDVRAKRHTSKDRSNPTLAVLLAASGPQHLPELCKAAGFDVNDTGHIETFYTMVRDELGKSIRIVGTPEENQRLEAITGAP
jgi:restriction endonuclease S subunit